uniref:Kell metallo-endopeptidase (Kell blood group) n=1 Tax=Oryzias latipes TaxID=8090 RepID=A0A3P9HST9_ORYLA
MSETSIELMPQLPVLSSSQPDSEKVLQPPALLQLPLTTQDPQQLQQQSQLQSELQQQENSGANLEQLAESVCVKHRSLLLLLLGISFFTAVSGLIFYIHHIFHVEKQTPMPPVTPCLSQACQRAAARLSTSADPFTQTCDHFLSKCGSETILLTSGGRQRGQGIPGHPQNQMEKSVWTQTPKGEKKVRGLKEGRLQSRKTLLLQYLKGMLETNKNSHSSAVQKTMDFYQSCLNTSSIEAAGEKPFLALIQKLGGWPVSGIWNKTDFNSTLALLMRDYATFPFFNLYVGKDPNETTSGVTKRRYIQIDQPDLLIPIEWNSKTEKSGAKAETLRPFLALCQKYLALLGSPQTTSTIHVYMFISLSSELAVAASPLQYRLLKGQLHQHMSIKELQRQAPAIDWLDCLQAVFHPLSLSKDDHVLLHNLPYIVHMSQIINKWQNKPDISNSGPLHTYMLLNLLHTLMPAMDSRFSETSKAFSGALGNDDEEIPRWKHCVLAAERGFDSVLIHLLKNVTAHREAEKMTEDVFFLFKSKLHQLSWVDQNYSQLFTNKVNSLIPRLWTPIRTSGENELDLLFSQVNISSHNFFSNYIQLLTLWQKRRSKLLISPSEPIDVLSLTPFPLGNEVLVPMGMFIPPLFHPTYPRAYNYGAAGFLLAKDIFHLLLPEIHSYSDTVPAVAECLLAHYLRTTEKAGRSGVLTLSASQQQELWVQYSALEVALTAYHQSLIPHSDDTSLLGLSHTHLFLTSFSQMSCDSDPYQEFMPLDPAFLIAVICARSNLCPAMQCSVKNYHISPQSCGSFL